MIPPWSLPSSEEFKVSRNYPLGSVFLSLYELFRCLIHFVSDRCPQVCLFGCEFSLHLAQIVYNGFWLFIVSIQFEFYRESLRFEQIQARSFSRIIPT